MAVYHLNSSTFGFVVRGKFFTKHYILRNSSVFSRTNWSWSLHASFYSR